MKIEKKIPDFFPFWFFLSCSVKKKQKPYLKTWKSNGKIQAWRVKYLRENGKNERESEEDEVLNHQEPFLSVDLFFLSLIQTPKPG